ncbi:MAG: type II secretion system GspH family protein [Verrucomicrobiota bacterium]|nr:type II secretion system GspH family protein [Verrucomicrobiota bacterium]
MQVHPGHDCDSGFTLIELLVVIAIIAVLAGLAFPVMSGVMDRAKKVQAKNDTVQIVTAVNAYYTEYGRYPVDVPAGNTADASFGPGAAPFGATAYGDNSVILNVLRSNTRRSDAAAVASLNPRQVVFLSLPEVKQTSNPGAGVTAPGGVFYDPWGSQYQVLIDANYDNELTNPYSANSGAGSANLQAGVIGWSVGKNGALGGGAAAAPAFAKEGGSPNNYAASGDVISWQ